MYDYFSLFRYFSSFYSCSLARRVRVCEPHSDGVTSFSHLLDSAIVRWCVWLVAAMACLGNACVMVGRTVVRQVNGVHSFYIKVSFIHFHLPLKYIKF